MPRCGSGERGSLEAEAGRAKTVGGSLGRGGKVGYSLGLQGLGRWQRKGVSKDSPSLVAGSEVPGCGSTLADMWPSSLPVTTLCMPPFSSAHTDPR